MENRENEIQDLRERTKQNRRQFLETDVQTCIAIERAELELSLGNSHQARKELAVASRGADVIEGFLREAEPREADPRGRLGRLSRNM